MPHEKSEVLIVKNPMFYKDLNQEAFNALIVDGRWIPLVFGAIEKVVEANFMELCEIDWDYLRVDPDATPDVYKNYKSVFYKGLDENQKKRVCEIADQIEEEIQAAAIDALVSLNQNADDESNEN